MSKHGHTALFNYIDDLLYCDLPSKIQGPSEYLVSLLQELGFTMSDKQLTPPKKYPSSLLGDII